MNENTRKRIITFTLQALKEQGIRAVRMDVVAKSMNISKRTLYQLYETKDKLMAACLEAYADRLQNLFRLIECEHPAPAVHLRKLAQTYTDHLCLARRVFWCDVITYHPTSYAAINRLWTDELGRIIRLCQSARCVPQHLEASAFSDAFTSLLFYARVADCPSAMLHNSAGYLLQGILDCTEAASGRQPILP